MAAAILGLSEGKLLGRTESRGGFIPQMAGTFDDNCLQSPTIPLPDARGGNGSVRRPHFTDFGAMMPASAVCSEGMGRLPSACRLKPGVYLLEQCGMIGSSRG